MTVYLLFLSTHDKNLFVISMYTATLRNSSEKKIFVTMYKGYSWPLHLTIIIHVPKSDVSK